MSAVSNRLRENSKVGARKACSGRKERARLTVTKRPRLTPMGKRWKKSSAPAVPSPRRSEEHTSELQSRLHLVCRLLLEKKKKTREDTALARLRRTNFQVPKNKYLVQ